jgi:phage terminase large subunit
MFDAAPVSEAVRIRRNKKFKFLYTDKSRFIILRGSAGSGKSYALAQHAILSLMQEKVKWMVLRKTGRSLRESVFALLRSVIAEMDLYEYFKVNKTDMSIEFANGSMIIMSGLDDVEKLKSIHGVDKIWIEEASEITEADFKQINLRLRGKGKNHQIYLSFNPIDENHWIKNVFFDIGKDNATLHHSTYKDNSFLDEEYKQELEKLKNIDEYYYKVYALGEWGSISNARVFHNVVIEDFKYKPEDLQNIRYGQDYGFVHASTLMGCGFRENDMYIFMEHYYKEHTNGQFIKKVEASGFNKKNEITGDSAEPDRILEWKQAGFRVHGAIKGKNSLYDGIDFLQNIPRIHIHKTNCPNAAREFLGYKRRELKDGTITEQYVELDDDTIAGVRYAVESIRRNSAPNINTPIMR